ncbi:secondary thiamine-phosphate synthase enzyme YjbQ [Seleniivibrio woodruffii]|uniref:secondary thiamine-phosphate synthase enzyme YjbQ n=1 Tax=Seleniivibrio woodruffii TaxID=1078050 RepID=UPI0039E2C90B
MFTLNINTSARCQLVDITRDIESRLAAHGLSDGILVVFTPHTTSAITINENADPDVQTDMNAFLSKLIPAAKEFRHYEGNSDSHIKSSLVGASETIIVENGKMVLGTWQGIYFCEFDGPRQRKVYLKFIGS